MISLDNLEEIRIIDKVNVLGSIEQLGQQCQQAWQEVDKIEFPEQYKSASSIVFQGMGGSALGAYVLKSLFYDKIKRPFEIMNDYHLPSYVDEKTLVIVSSYSGTTEETLSVANEAKKKNACVVGLAAGGELADFLKENSYPSYIFDPIYNPSKQPRLGTGYMAMGPITILKKLGILEMNNDSIETLKKFLNEGNKLYGVTKSKENNPAKILAKSWINKIPIIVSAEYLSGVGRVLRNQLHESAKNFADYYPVPELNHHLMEGLKNPPQNKELLEFLFLDSADYSPKIQKRMEITKEVVSKNGIHVESFTPQSSDRLTQAFECVQFGAYTNYYLALLYGLDPSKIPWVDFFKKKLANS